MDALFKPHRQILFSLIDHHVEFILIGGYSVIYYGYSRGTNDLDIWLKPDNKNKIKLLNALDNYGIDSTDLKKLANVDFTKTSMFYIGKKPNKIDFLTKVQNVDWNEAIKNVKYFPFNNKKIPIVGFHDLIKMKIASERLKDKADVEELQKIRRDGDKK